jgi:hypothetical protein
LEDGLADGDEKSSTELLEKDYEGGGDGNISKPNDRLDGDDG